MSPKTQNKSYKINGVSAPNKSLISQRNILTAV